MKYVEVLEYQKLKNRSTCPQVLVLEGNIVNLLQIKNSLHISEQNDVETEIIHVIKKVGLDAFRMFRGDFFLSVAFEKKIFLCMGNTFRFPVRFSIDNGLLCVFSKIDDIPDISRRMLEIKGDTYTKADGFGDDPILDGVHILRYGELLEFDIVTGEYSRNILNNPCFNELKYFDESEAISAIRETLESVISGIDYQNRNVVVFVSGGIDSSIIATLTKKYAKNVTLCSVGTEKNNEFLQAQRIGKYLNTTVKNVVINEEEFPEAFCETIRLLEHSDSRIVEYMLPEILAYKHVAKPGDLIMSGYGSDILFGGFSSESVMKTSQMVFSEYKSVQYSNEMSINIDESFSVDTIYPYFDYRFLSVAFAISSNLKTKHGVEKYILRKAYEDILPDEIVWRKKVGIHQTNGSEKFISELLKEYSESQEKMRMLKNKLAYEVYKQIFVDKVSVNSINIERLVEKI